MSKINISLYVTFCIFLQAARNKVVRLPRYHCRFNSRELVWFDVKAYIPDNNKTLNDMEVMEHQKGQIGKRWTYMAPLQQRIGPRSYVLPCEQ